MTKLRIKQISRILAVVYIVSVLPMLAISMYNYPSADDFAMGVWAYRAFRDTGSVLAVVGKSAYMAWHEYLRWMGYFTSTFFMSMPPSVFGEQYYVLGTYIILGAYTFAMLYFMRALLVKALGADADTARCYALLLLIFTVQCMPQGIARVEAFYWYCSAANYVLLYSFGLIFLGLLLSAACDTGRGKRIYDLTAATVLGFFVGGGNYMTSLSVAIVCVLAIGWILLRRRKEYGMLILPMGAMLIGFVLSCIAPGNSNRAEALTGMGPVKAIFVSLYYTLSYPVNQWTNWAVLVFLLLLIPFHWKLTRRLRLTYRYPLIAAVLAYGLASANITPPMYAESNIGAGRLQALFWMQYLLLLTMTEGYVIGWAQRYVLRCLPGKETAEKTAREKAGGGAAFSRVSSGYLIFLTGFLLFGSALSLHVNPDFYTSGSAMEDLLNGHAQTYRMQNEERRRILCDPSVTDAVLEPYTFEPDLLFFSDIMPDPADWTNEAMRRYYDKESVRRKPRPNETVSAEGALSGN